MKPIFATFGAFLFAFFVVGMVSGASIAQSEDPKMLEVCNKGKDKIPAEKLPSVVDLDKCPVGDRPVVDNGVGVILPEPGEGVYAEVLSPGGSQELVVSRLSDGKVELSKVGDDAGEGASSQKAESIFTAASGPNQCRDRAYDLTRWRVYGGLKYRFNYRTTPPYLNRNTVAREIRRGGANITRTRNSCGFEDKVEQSLVFEGNIRRQADVNADGSCQRSDGVSVASFGKLRGSVLAITCTYFVAAPDYDKVTSSDLELDRSGVKWTTSPGARSCSDRYDIQAVVTHERGHTFGMGHVLERDHPNLTMSTIINGPCQASERSLGRGDVLGLARKYR